MTGLSDLATSAPLDALNALENGEKAILAGETEKGIEIYQSILEIYPDNKGDYYFGSNHSGGILGGISSGQPIVAKFIVKPTSSILTEKNSINLKKKIKTL